MTTTNPPVHNKLKITGVIATIVLVIYMGFWGAGKLSYRSTMNHYATMNNKKTICVGRYLLDLPEGLVASTHGGGAINGSGDISVTPNVSLEEFNRIVAKRIADLKAIKSRDGQGIALGGIGKFSQLSNAGYFWYWRDADYHGGSYLVERYYWLDGRMIKSASEEFFSSGSPAELAPHIEHLFNRIKPRGDFEIPSEPGTCMPGIFLPDEPSNLHTYETTGIGIDMLGHDDVGLSLSTSTVAASERLIDRRNGSPLPVAIVTLGQHRELRKERRFIGPLEGDELLDRFREDLGAVKYVFEWEYPGNPPGGSVITPFITLSMSTGNGPERKAIHSSLDEAQALALWDTLIPTLRLRPNAGSPRRSPRE